MYSGSKAMSVMSVYHIVFTHTANKQYTHVLQEQIPRRHTLLGISAIMNTITFSPIVDILGMVQCIYVCNISGEIVASSVRYTVRLMCGTTHKVTCYNYSGA